MYLLIIFMKNFFSFEKLREIKFRVSFDFFQGTLSLFHRRMSETDSRNVDMYLVNPTDIFKDDTMLEKWKMREMQNNFPLVQQYPNNDDETMMNEIPMFVEDQHLIEFLQQFKKKNNNNVIKTNLTNINKQLKLCKLAGWLVVVLYQYVFSTNRHKNFNIQQ